MTEIYKITNLINQKIYIGATRKGYKNRFKQHCNSVKNHKNTLIGQAIAEYGEQNFKVEVLKTVPDSEADFWEMYFIDKYKSLFTQNGYNVTAGGKSNPMDAVGVKSKHKAACNTPEHKKQVAKGAKNRVWTPEQRKQVADRNRTNPELYYSGFRKYNEAKKIQVGIIQDDKIVLRFNSLADACRYVGKPSNCSGVIMKNANKFNKNGKRAKVYGYSWVTL